MEIIKIKRSARGGLKDCEGIFFEHEGFQFCFINDDLNYYMIELSSGANAIDTSIKNMSFSKAFDLAKRNMEKKTGKDIQTAMSAFKKKYSREFKFPVNQPIIKTT